MDYEKQVIELKNKMVVLNVQPFDTDINIDDLLKIDYSNLVGEILTFPVLLNRIMNLKAEMQNIVKESELDLEVFEAGLSEKKRNLLSSSGAKVTVKEVENAVVMDKTLIDKKKRHYERVKNLDYLDGLYWSAQSKSKLLEKISDKIRPEEFSQDLLEDTINGVQIKYKQKAIK